MPRPILPDRKDRGLMTFTTTLGGRRYQFDDLKTLLAKATPGAFGRPPGRRRGADGAGARGGAASRSPTCRWRTFLNEPSCRTKTTKSRG